MKNFLVFTTFILLMYYAIFNSNLVKQVYKVIYKEASNYTESNYSVDYKFEHLQKTDDFTPKNKKELINILYTVIDSDMTKFIIYCDDSYNTCVNDMDDISKDGITLSTINTYVHPYNTYSKIKVSTNIFNFIIIDIEKAYSYEEIEYIENELNNIEKKLFKSNISNREKIRIFHDYILDYAEYDKEQAKFIEIYDEYYSNTYKANGLLKKKKALCGGYTDIMSIYLNRLNIPNYRIASSNHIWNYVYVDNKWYHLDLTWDDPVLTNSSSLILHDFFLIDTKKLESYNTTKHIYDKNLYIEAK